MSETIETPDILIMVGGFTGTNLVPNSVMATCEDCKNNAWMAPSSVEVIVMRARKRLPTQVICALCMVKRLKSEDDEWTKKED